MTGPAGSPSSDEVAGSGPGSDRIRIFARRWQHALFVVTPVLTAMVLAANGFFVSDPMVETGLLGVIAGFAVFLVFANRVPQAFALVRLRGLISAADRERYEAFERRVERQLNSRWSLAPAAVGIAFALAYFPIRAGGFAAVFGTGPGSLQDLGPLVPLLAVGTPVLWFVAGLAIWRMIVVGMKLDELGRCFDLQLQLGHPDQCAGFEPLGSLSLWNALVLAVPGLFLGWWIAVGPTSQYGNRWLGLDSVLAVVVVVLSLLAFVAPLWNVHRAMARSANRLAGELEERGRAIDRLARELLTGKDALSSQDRAEKAKDLELQQALYRDNEHIPTWPINLRLALRFGTSQLVPLLGLTGLGKPIVDAVGRFATFLGG